MAKENEGQALREYGNRKKRLKRRKRAFFTMTFTLLVVIGAIYVINLYNRNYKNYEILKTANTTGEGAVGYFRYNNFVVKYSKDGAVAVDRDGGLLWNGAYEMSNPIVDTCGHYVAIADRDGKSVHIYNKEGKVNDITTDYNIVKVEIASQGVIAVLMEAGDKNYVKVYDDDGTVLVDMMTSENTEGYPLDMSLSENGEKLVFSYISYAGGILTNKLSFYNFNEVGKNFTEGFVGGWSYTDLIIPRVEFVNNDTVCAFTENGLQIYHIKETPKDPIEINPEGEIQSILYNQEYVGVVEETEGTSERHIKLYNLEGDEVLKEALNFQYENIYLSDKEVIMYNNTSCLIMRLNGREKFIHTFDSNIKGIFPINNLDRYYLAKDNKLYVIQLKE